MDGVSDVMTGAVAVGLPGMGGAGGGAGGAYAKAPSGEPMFGGAAGADFASATTGYVAPDASVAPPPVYEYPSGVPYA